MDADGGFKGRGQNARLRLLKEVIKHFQSILF